MAALIQDADAEVRVLAACLIEEGDHQQENVSLAVEALGPQHFTDPLRRSVWQAIAAVFEVGRQVDPYRAAEKLAALTSGRSGLDEVLAVTDSRSRLPDDIRDDLARLHEMAMRRSMARAGERLQEVAADPASDIRAAGEKAADHLLQAIGGQEEAAATSREVASLVFERLESPRPRLKTGLLDLDAVLGGIESGQVSVIAGRPGMGKTTVMVDLAVRYAKQGKRVLFFSLEMNAEQLGQRFVAHQGNVPYDLLRDKPFDDPKLQRSISRGVAAFAELPIIIDYRSGLTTGQIRATVKLQQARGGVDVMFLDYLGLLGDGRDGKMGDTERVTFASWNLARLAKDLGVPVVAGSQINRKSEERGNRKPSLADLRDSGAVEQDAAAVLLLWRPYYYDHSQNFRLLEVEVAKNRYGPTGAVSLYIDPPTGVLGNLDRKEATA